MTATVPVSDVKNAIKIALGEAFDEVIGMYLDKGDSLWPTLEPVTAAQASVPIAPGSNSIAGQISHMIFYFDVMAMYMRGEEPGPQNWATAWEVVSVNEDEWKELKRALGERQAETLVLIDNTPDEIFTNPDFLAGSYGIVAHTAFHLGQIHHALAAQGN